MEAQMAEREPHNLKVVSSNSASGTYETVMLSITGIEGHV